MALVQSRQLPEGGKFKSVNEVLRAMRGAAEDELSAQNLYSEIIDLLSISGVDESITERIRELKKDEEMHLGSLLFIIETLDNNIAENLQKGAQGG